MSRSAGATCPVWILVSDQFRPTGLKTRGPALLSASRTFCPGAIKADPAERDKCRWCDFAHACRYTEAEGLAAGA